MPVGNGVEISLRHTASPPVKYIFVNCVYLVRLDSGKMLCGFPRPNMRMSVRRIDSLSLSLLSSRKTIEEQKSFYALCQVSIQISKIKESQLQPANCKFGAFFILVGHFHGQRQILETMLLQLCHCPLFWFAFILPATENCKD